MDQPSHNNQDRVRSLSPVSETSNYMKHLKVMEQGSRQRLQLSKPWLDLRPILCIDGWYTNRQRSPTPSPEKTTLLVFEPILRQIPSDGISTLVLQLVFVAQGQAQHPAVRAWGPFRRPRKWNHPQASDGSHAEGGHVPEASSNQAHSFQGYSVLEGWKDGDYTSVNGIFWTLRKNRAGGEGMRVLPRLAVLVGKSPFGDHPVLCQVRSFISTSDKFLTDSTVTEGLWHVAAEFDVDGHPGEHELLQHVDLDNLDKLASGPERILDIEGLNPEYKFAKFDQSELLELDSLERGRDY